MAYSDNFPATRPVFMADFANGGRIDPRATFSRSDTPPTYAAPSAVHYWSNEKHLSSENLLSYSDDVSQPNWIKDGLSETGGQTAPDGGTDAYKLTENTANDEHRIYQASSERITSSGSLTVSVHLKYIGRQWAVIRITDSTGTDRRVWFDIQNGTKGTEETNMTGSITASGNGYYKCVATISSVAPSPGTYVMIAGADADNSYVYTGSGADAFAVWGIQASTTGESVLNETSGQIHREYAPTLKSVATAGQPRFEYDPASDGQSMGTSLGILIEGQATNLYGNSLDMTGVSQARTNIDLNVAVGPTGQLTADAIRLDATNSDTHTREYSFTAAASTAYTFSVYLKAAGMTHAVIRPNNLFAESYVYFNLSNGTVEGSPTLANSMTAVGNGWYRCSVTATTTGSGAGSFNIYITDSGSSTTVGTGDSYRAILGQGIQIETGSHPSSFIETSGGTTATRAAESLSVVDSSLFDNGSGALAAEYDMFAASETSYLLHIEKSSGGTNGGGISVTNRYLGVESNYLDLGNTTSNVFHKVAASWETGSQKMSRDGGAASEDTSTVLPSGTDKLFIGVRQDGNEPVNGHIKRIAIYSEPLSSTNLQALTS